MNTTQDSVIDNNMGVIEGYAFIWATKRTKAEDILAMFVCPGKGDGEHCFERARSLARAAGFSPLA